MKTIFHKSVLSTALGFALGGGAVPVVNADAVLSMELGDVDGDGVLSDFQFAGPPVGLNFFGATGETGCVNAADGNTCDPIFFDFGSEIDQDVFTTGFQFSFYGEFKPNIRARDGSGSMSATITIDENANRDMSFSALDFGGNFVAGSGTEEQFYLPPSTPDGTIDLSSVIVEKLVSRGDGTFETILRWISVIPPDQNFGGQEANWRLEGLTTVSDQPPIIYINGGSGVAGNVTTNAEPDTVYSDAGAACVDVVDGQITDPVAFTTTINNPNDPLTGPDGSTFTVVYECTDSSTQTTTATRTVEVGSDTIPPVVTLNVGPPEAGRSDSTDGSVVDIVVGVPYIDAGATCVDNRDGDIPLGSANFAVTPDPAVVDTSTPSTGNDIVFSCTDAAGNGPTVATRTVNVLADDQPPVITLIGPNPLTVAVGDVYQDPGAVCEDTNPVDADPIDISDSLDVDPLSIDTSAPASYPVTYSCTDTAGNTDQVIRTVNVVAGQTFEIISMTVSDVDGDRIAGCFKFNFLDPVTCSLANRFSSDDSVDSSDAGAGNATIPGTGTDLDENGNPIGVRFGEYQPITEFIDPGINGLRQPVGPISPGFLFLGFPFVPLTFDPPSESTEPPRGFVTVSGSQGILSIESFPWSGLYQSDKPNAFFLDPDEGTLNAEITQVNNDDDGSTRTFNYLMTWSHVITPEEDPTGNFINNNAFWRLEGVITTGSTPVVRNNPPLISSLTASQDDRDPTTIVVATDGVVTARVQATDPDGDALTYDWSQSPVTPVSGMDSQDFVFDVSEGQEDGPIVLKVIVTDDKGEDSLSTSAQKVLNFMVEAPVLSPEEAEEGFGDDDNDGIANFQDPIDGIVEPTRNLVDFSDPGRGDIVVSTGRLMLGQVSAATANGIFVVTEDDIAAYGGPGASAVDNAQDRLNRVYGPGFGPVEGATRDFMVTSLEPGGIVQVVLPQDTPLPAQPIYRKWTAGKGWVPFETGSGNALASASKVGGVCPGPTDPAYDTALNDEGATVLVEGDDCVRLTIRDGGPNDGDAIANGVVLDPSTPSGNGPVPQKQKGDIENVFGQSGCTLGRVHAVERFDWWILLLFVGWLGRQSRARTFSKK